MTVSKDSLKTIRNTGTENTSGIFEVWDPVAGSLKEGGLDAL